MAAKLESLKKPKTETVAEIGAMPTKAAVKSVVAQVRKIDQVIAKARGEKGALIKSASVDENIDKAALREVTRRLAMEPEARVVYQRQVAHMEDALGIALQLDLFKDAKPSKSATPRPVARSKDDDAAGAALN